MVGEKAVATVADVNVLTRYHRHGPPSQVARLLWSGPHKCSDLPWLERIAYVPHAQTGVEERVEHQLLGLKGYWTILVQIVGPEAKTFVSPAGRSGRLNGKRQ